MDNKRKNIFSLIIIFVIFCLVFVIHSGIYDPDGRKTITIGAFTGSYWDVQNGNSYKILDNAIAKFEEQNPGWRVKYESGITKDDYSDWLYGKLLEGDAPDLFFVFDEDFDVLSEMGTMAELDRLMENDDELMVEDFYNTSFTCGTYKGIQYALPYESAVDLMFVNKTILSEEGIELPPDDWKWDDFYSICEKITKDTNGDGINDRFGVCNYNWEKAMNSNNVGLFDETGNVVGLGSEEAVEAVDFVERLENLNDGYNVTSNDFDLGNVAFQPLMFSQYRAYKPYPLRVKKYSSFEWDCVTMPAGPKGKNTSYMDTLLLAINKNTHYEKKAWEFMKILTADEEIQSQIFTYSEGASPLKSVTGSSEITSMLEKEENIQMSLLDTAMENATVMPSFKNYVNAVRTVDSAVREVLEGDSNISMSLIKKQRDINNYLKNENQIS